MQDFVARDIHSLSQPNVLFSVNVLLSYKPKL